MNYIGVECPVCKKKFEIEDDVVVCEKCGTPHHRECYKENSRCYNYEKHQDGSFRWVHPKIDLIEKSNLKVEKIRPLVVSPFFSIREDEDFDGAKAIDLARFIKINVPYYIQVFKLMKDKKKRIFNFSSFLFPAIWMIYRKLYKIAIPILFFDFFVAFASKYINVVVLKDFFTEVFSKSGLSFDIFSTFGFFSFADIQSFLGALSMMPFNMQIIYWIPKLLSFSKFLIMLYIGLNSNKLYLKKCVSEVNAVKAKYKEEYIKEIDKVGGVDMRVFGIISFALVLFFLEAILS